MPRVLRRFLLAILAAVVVALVSEAAYRVERWFGAPRWSTTGTRFEMYGVGESTLVGEPFEPKISVPRLLEYVFSGAVAGRPIAVKNLARRGEPLYPQSIAFEEAVAARDVREPGVVLILSGHNEGIPPGDAGDRPPFVPDIATEHSALLRDAVLALRRRHVISREKSLAAYEYYLRRVIETAQSKGLLPILATMASNVSRIEPNYDGNDATETIVKRGIALEAEHRYAEARDLYWDAAAGRGPGAAMLAYRAGRCAEALGDFAAARESYWNAVDLDPRTMFGRATRAQNDLVRHLAREYRIPFVDAVEIFEQHSAQAILGEEMIIDGQHPTLEGYRLLATAVADIICDRFGATIANPLGDASAVAAALGFGPLDEAGALIDAGSWLLATSVGHPFADDRIALAAERFASAGGKGDDFSAWMGIALTQAALRGGILRDPATAPEVLGYYAKSYRVALPKLPSLLPLFEKVGVDADVVQRVRRLGAELAAAS